MGCPPAAYRQQFTSVGDTSSYIVYITVDQWRIQELPRGDHGERAEREPKKGSRGKAPSGVQGQSPWWGAP